MFRAPFWLYGGVRQNPRPTEANGCTYLIGRSYLATVGSGGPGAIDEERFDEIIATFRLAAQE